MQSISLLVVLFAALLTPLLMAKFNIHSLPTAVAEIIVGIILGKSLFGWVVSNDVLEELRTLGVIVLIFLSGMEIDFSLFKPQKQAGGKIGVAPLAFLSYGSIVAMAFAAAWVLNLLGLYQHIVFAAIIFATVALGVVIAALKEQELLSKPFGQTILLLAALGEVLPLIALTVYQNVNGSSSRSVWLLLLIFVAAIILLLRFRKPYQWFAEIDKSTTQLDIRLAFFLIVTLVTVAESVGAENILGAFLAGMVMKLLRPREETEDKLTSIGYGFFIPIFFIMTGANMNLRAMFKDPASLALIPVLLIGFYAAKALLVPLLLMRFRKHNALAGMLLTSTTITLVIPALSIGKTLGIISSTQSAAFTLAAVITCIVSPILFNTFYVAEKDDIKKTHVHIIGANLLTVPIVQQLSKGLYEVHLYTDDPVKFKTYNSEAPVTLLPDVTASSLQAAKVFDADIMVLAHFDENKNFDVAQQALAAKVPRIIARFDAKNATDTRYDELADQGVEVYNTFETNIAMLRSLIETPSTLKILQDTTAGIFEIVVNNRRFAGLEVKNLPYVNDITISQIFRGDHFIAPHGDTQLHLGDHIIFSGDKAQIGQMRAEFEKAN